MFDVDLGTEASNEDDTHADTVCFGKNFRMIEHTGRVCDVVPYDDNYAPRKDVPIVTACTATQCPDSGEIVIVIIRQGLWFGRSLDHSLINPNQLRVYGCVVNNDPTDKSRFFGIDTNQDFRIPFETEGAVVKWKSWVPTDEELYAQGNRHIYVTDDYWDPENVQLSSVTAHTPEEEEFRTLCSLHHMGHVDEIDDEFAVSTGEPVTDEIFVKRAISSVNIASSRRLETDLYVHADIRDPLVYVGAVGAENRHSAVTAEELSKKWRCSLDTASSTLKLTTQRGIRHAQRPLGRRYRTDHLDHNRRRLNDTYFTDTFFMNVKSLKQNTCGQVYTNGSHTAVYPMLDVTQVRVGATLTSFSEDFGIPDTLVADLHASQVGIHTDFRKEVNRLKIKLRMTEKGRHSQNYAAEQEIQGLKRRWKALMNEKQVPRRLWDYGMVYMAEIMSRTARGNEGIPGLQRVLGHTIDISEWLDFEFYDLVWWWDPTVPQHISPTPKRLGRWLGVAHRVGTQMCYFILTSSGEVIASTTVQHVLRTELQVDETKELVKKFDDGIKERLNDENFMVNLTGDDIDFYLDDIDKPMGNEVGDDVNGIEPDEKEYQDQWGPDVEDVEQDDFGKYDRWLHAKVKYDVGGEEVTGTVKKRRKTETGYPIGTAHDNPMFDSREYEIELPDGTIDFMTANHIAVNIYSQCDANGRMHEVLESIEDHKKDETALTRGRDTCSHTSHNGNWSPVITTKGWKLLVKWKGGDTSWIPLSELKSSNPVETAEYAVANKLVDEPAFRWWVPHTLRYRNRIISKLKKKYFRTTHKFGLEVPKDVKRALEIDYETGTDFWKRAIEREMRKVMPAFEVYKEHTPEEILKRKDLLVGYKKIACHMIFDVKMTLERKARFVAGGHMTEDPATGTYSSVVSRDSVRIAFTLAALNDVDVLACDVSNAYLNAECREKIWFKAGMEFGEFAGYAIVIKRALYGLKSSGAAWRALLKSTIEGPRMKFVCTIADQDVYRREACKPNGDKYYEYILVYVDDILIVSHDPEPILEELKALYELKEGSIGPPNQYLGAQISQVEGADGGLKWAMSSEKYATEACKIIDALIEKDGVNVSSKGLAPIAPNYVPELDDSPELNDEMTSHFMQAVGILRWMTELGRVDVLYATAVLSQHMASPREGHLRAVYGTFKWIKKHLHSGLVFDDTPVDVEVSEDQDWTDIFGEELEEELPPRMPEPRGKKVSIHCFVDANHAGNVVTRRSHTGIIIFLNNSPIMWYSKRQNTVEASSFGSEFVAMRIAVEMVVALRYKLRMFGVPLDGPANVFCDNAGVVKNASIPASTLNKKHNAINYHYVREASARRIIKVTKEDGNSNVADAFTKALSLGRLKELLSHVTTWIFPKKEENENK